MFYTVVVVAVVLCRGQHFKICSVKQGERKRDLKLQWGKLQCDELQFTVAMAPQKPSLLV